MADSGSGLTGGVEGLEHVGRQLYTQAVSGALQIAQGAAGAAGSLQSELGESAFAHAIKDGRRPPDSTWQLMDSWYEFHTGLHQELNEAIDTSQNSYAPRFAQALQGEAGDALQAKLRDIHRLWAAHADRHEAAGLASYRASAIVQNAQRDIDLIAEDGEQEFNDAVQRRDPVAALQVWRTYSGQADDVVSDTEPKVRRVLQEARFDIPQDPAPTGNNAQTDPPKDKPKAKPAKNEHQQDGTQADVKPSDGTDGTQTGVAPGDDHAPVPDKPMGDGTQTNPSPQLGESPFIPGNFGPAGGGGGLGSGAGGGGGRMPSLGSGLPSQLGSMSGLGAGTSPATSIPQVPASGAVPSSAAAPAANAGSSFQSGLASGMGATGGMTSPVSPPAQPVAAAAPPVAAANGGAAGMGPAGVGPSSGWTSAPVDAAGAAGGHGGGGAPIMGGGGMMPPTAMGAQPLAPYSPPGTGASGAGGAVAPSSPTATGASTASAGTGPGVPPPMVAGSSAGTAGAMAALGGSSADVNPDVLTAQRILGELAQGSEASRMLVLWAVVVLRSPVGSHIAVANNVGGGGYLPAAVYLPSTVRLAVSDPALPMGWADVWMGCQSPSKILVDYCDRLGKVNAGMAVSALVTTELYAERPHDFAGEFLGVDHRDALRLVSEPPKLDAAHQHRLAVLDPALYQRVNGLHRGGNMAAWAAATLTRAVFGEGLRPDGTGAPLVEQADAQMLEAVSASAATAQMWAAYDRAAAQRHDGAAMWPNQHAPRDNDGSDLARASMLWYSHYYRVGRMIELVQCWKNTAPRLAELAYCGIKAGFGPTVATAVAAMEQHIAQQRR